MVGAFIAISPNCLAANVSSFTFSPQSTKSATPAKKASTPAKKALTSANVKTPAAKPQTKNQKIVSDIDTVESGTFMHYKKNTPIGKVISELGATEISQHHRGNSYYDYSRIMLPARIARVAKGEHSRHISKVQSILADDMIEYFELNNKLNTPLKRKAFSSDPNYQWFVNEFEEVRNQLFKHIFYVSIPIESEYDLDSGTFIIPLPYNIDKGKYAHAYQLAENMFIQPFLPDFEITDSRIILPVDENIAIKTEGEGCSLVIMGCLDPNLGAFGFENGISFFPLGLYIVKDTDGAIIATLKDTAEGIELYENDGQGSIPEEYDDGEGDGQEDVLLFPWPPTSEEPDDGTKGYKYVYEGRIGNNPIKMYFDISTEEKEGVRIYGICENTKTDDFCEISGIRKGNEQFLLDVYDYERKKVAECLLELKTSDDSLHGTLKEAYSGQTSQVHVRRVFSTLDQ